MRSRVEASGGVKASLLLALDLLCMPANSSCSPKMLAGRLMQELRWVMQDPGAIMEDKSLNVILSNGLADPLGMKLLEL